MNKNLYRIVFNKARGMLMVVADIAASGRASSSPSSGPGRTLQSRISLLSPLQFALLLSLGCVTYSVDAKVIADSHAAGKHQAIVSNSANGTPLITIQTPSKGGVSRNVYSQFDVDKKGVVLNNSHANTQSQLAGMITGNPNLVRGEAKVILNEVNSANASQLRGFIEVAGTRAQVVIANPSGITCNGCGFINANRATLTTGQVQMTNGSISGYDVNQGEIVVKGEGMESRQQDSTDLIARAVSINSAVWANELKVSAGRNTVDADHHRVNAKAANGSVSPGVAIDVAALGGMYANKIRLLGTEKGVGVHNAGNIGASAGDVVLNADGSITNSGSFKATRNLQIISQNSINNTGKIYATGNTDIKVSGSLSNGGTIAANADTTLSAASISNTSGSTLGAGINGEGSKGAAGNLTLTSQGQLTVNGQALAAGQLKAKGTTVNFSGSQTHGETLSLEATSGDLSTAKATVEATRKLTASAFGKLNNAGGSVSAETLALSGRSLANQQGTLQQLGDSDLRLSFAEGIDNEGGTLASNSKNLRLTTAFFTNQHGQLIAGQQGSVQIETQKLLNNQQGVIAAAGRLSLKSGGMNNEGGLLQSGAAMDLDLHGGDLNNRNSGSNGGILSHSTLTLKGGNIDNTAGFMAAGGDASLTGLNFTNQQGMLSSETGVNLVSQAMDNQHGRVQAGTELLLNTQGSTLSNISGIFSAGKTLTLLTGTLLNRSGKLLSSDALELNTSGQRLDNSSGLIAANKDAQIKSGTLDNAEGQLQIAGDLLISLWANERREVSSATSLNNNKGLISSGAELTLIGADTLALSNTSGTLIAGNSLNLTAKSLSGDGRVLSQGAMALTLQQAFFNQGEVIANGNLTFNLGGNGLNNQSIIKAGGALTLTAGSLNNQHPAEVSAGENHLIITGNVTNRGVIDGGLTHIVSSSLTNLGSGRLYGDHIALQTGTLNNLAENGIAATIAARERLDIGAQLLNNRDHALIYSSGDMAIGGALDSNWNASAQGSVFNNISATVESAGNMTLNIGQINNINDHLVTETVLVERSSHHEAVLSSSVNRFDWDDIDHSKKDKDNVQYAIMPDGTKGRTFYEYEYVRTITETQVTESDPGQVLSGGNLTINSHQVNNHDSQMIAGGQLSGVIDELNNVATPGERVITDRGVQTRWYAKKTSGGPMGGTDTSQGKSRDKYQPEPIQQTLDLKTMSWQGGSKVSGSSMTMGGRDTAVTAETIIDAAAISANTSQTPITPPPGQIVEIVQPGSDGSNTIIREINPVTTLPDNSLFSTHLESGVPYLVETDPRFTNQKKWLGSDYMQEKLTQDPNTVLKRLGDGYYEQQLIRQQVIALTGNRYLAGYSNDEAQYRALMDAGVTFAKTLELKTGVALSAQQMALLTSDMVWLVEQRVTLPDGSMQTVLVPQLYARLRPGDLDGSGALLSGNAVSLAVSHDLTNSGHINGRNVTQLIAENLNNRGFIGGDRLDLQARKDISNLGGTLQGDSSLKAVAGRDINSISTLGGSVGNITLDRPAGIYVQNENGTLGLQAMNNVNLTASQISNAGAGSQTQIIAGNDLNLNTLTTTQSESGDWGGGNNRSLTQSTEVGSQINAGGDVSLSAGHDLNARAAAVTAENSLNVTAGNDLNLTSGEASYHLTDNSHQSSSGMFSSKSVTTHDEVISQTAIGSSFSGDSVKLQAGNDLTVSGSNVVGTQDVVLSAGRDLMLTAADETRQEIHQYQETKSGLSGTGGIGVTVGRSSLKTTDEGVTHGSAASTVGSTAGNVSLSAGNNLTVKGSDVLAGKDLTLSGSAVNILATENQSKQTHKVEQKQSGLTLALSGVVGSAINSAVTTATQASNETSGRLAVLKGMQAALTGVQAYQGASLAEAGGSEGSLVGVNLSYGSQSSKSEQTVTQHQNQASSLTAGNTLKIAASHTDINVQGSQLKAGGDASLSAARDVNLMSSQDSQKLEGKNESKGASLGVGINFGQGANGLSVNASINEGRGSESGNGTSHNESTVSAGNKLNIISGRDTSLTGAQVSGEKVTMEVGRNLTLSSEQDTDSYDSKQKNASAGGSVSFTGGSGSVSLSQDKMHSNYNSVQEQTGVFAGQDGFDIRVGEHTQLNGAVLGSTATVDKNKLDTGTLGWSDIKNEAEYKVEHQSVGVSTGGSIGAQFAGNAANNLLIGANRSDSDSSTTKSAVSEGSIAIRDQENQLQAVAELSRDVENANPGLGVIFDKEKEQQRLQEAQILGEIGVQVGDIARTQGQIVATKAANEKMKDVTPEQLQAVKDEWMKANPGKEPTDKNISDQAYQNFYNQAFTESGFGTGDKVQQAIQAATAAVQGLAGGNIAQAISGAASPYLAEQIHKLTEGNPEAQAMAHAVVGAVTSYASGNSALAGAAGAVSGELMAQLVMSQLYPGKTDSELTEKEKQTISALGTLAAGLAGGVAGDSTADAVAGAQAGQNSVNNNLFGGNEVAQGEKARQHGTDVLSCADNPSGEACQRGLAENKAYAAVLATGGVASLTAPAQAMWALGAGVNAGVQYAEDGTVNPVNSVIAGWTNVVSIGNGLTGTVIWNAAGGALTNQINGDDPLTGTITNGVGSALGYGFGKVATSVTNSAGKWITGGWDPKFNPDLLKYTEVKGQLGISKEMLPSKLPSAAGNITSSISSESGSSTVQKLIDGRDKNEN
ncbi:hemagglutinin repeat-containing protein [Erwinia sp.]|uniref:hemagglutinin repeat-containing protein n=1 Tax=Erwinia citreus TaxID=558 RepID=UPI003C75B167